MKRGAITAIILAAAGAVLLECKSKNVPFVSDTDQIVSYMSTSEDAIELFRGDGIIARGPYHIPGKSTIVRDSLLNHTRTISAVASGGTEDYGYLGFLREGLATVTDGYSIREFRTDSSGTSSKDNSLGLVRYGFFLKLGSDFQPYVGWVLYGYAQLAIPSGVTVTPLGSVPFAGDSRIYLQQPKGGVSGPSYVKLTDLGVVSPGSRMEIRAAAAIPALLTVAQDSGNFNQSMKVLDPSTCIDTVGTRSAAGQTFDLASLRYFAGGADSVAAAGSPYIVPFRTR